jgi:hypothetical protein
MILLYGKLYQVFGINFSRILYGRWEMVKISIFGWINGLLTELLFSPSLIKPVLT